MSIEPKDYETPITVLVSNGQYNVFDEPTPRNLELFKILREMGGISDTVKNGTYHFNVVKDETTGQHIATLNPA